MSIRVTAAKLFHFVKGVKAQKGLARKCKYCHFYRLADRNGVVFFRLDRVAADYTNDYFADTGIDRKEKEWYYRRGIPTFKVRYYGMTKENYNDYISDFDFYSAKNYCSTVFSQWYDHKLTTYYLLGAYNKYMPRHYYYIRKGKPVPIDIDPGAGNDIEDILSLLERGELALKSCTGGHGKGFYKIEKRQEGYCINNQKADRDRIRELLLSLDDYIVTDYCTPHKVFRDACGEQAFAILRPVVIYDEDDGPQITSILFRLGTSKAGLISDYDGCINCGVDLKTGKIFHPVIRSGDSQGIILASPISEHPDTGVDLETITVPDFDAFIRLIKEVSAHLPVTPFLVLDIVPTDSGYRILEINSHGQVKHAEPFFPFRKNKYNLKAFVTKDR